MTATMIKPVSINMDNKRIGLAIFLLKVGYFEVTHIPTINGISNIEIILIMSDKKSISKVFTSDESEGKMEHHTKKLTGVIMKAAKEEKAVSVTDSATWPRANCVKKFDTLPPGQQATNNIPNAIPGGIGKHAIMITVITGSRTNWDSNPVATAFF